jgi:hypothetical protein
VGRDVVPVTFLARASIAAATGDLKTARGLLEELGLDRFALRADNGTSVLELVERLGLADAYLRSSEGRLAENRPWIHAAAHYLRGEHLRAADVYASIGSRTDEAYARLRAARALAAEGRRPEADAELQQTLAFYRSVGATRFIREAEELLAQTA